MFKIGDILAYKIEQMAAMIQSKQREKILTSYMDVARLALMAE